MDEMNSAQPKRWRRFSLRFLLGLVAICAVGCWGYWGAWPWWQVYQEQRQFIEDVKRLDLQTIDARYKQRVALYFGLGVRSSLPPSEDGPRYLDSYLRPWPGKIYLICIWSDYNHREEFIRCSRIAVYRLPQHASDYTAQTSAGRETQVRANHELVDAATRAYVADFLEVISGKANVPNLHYELIYSDPPK